MTIKIIKTLVPALVALAFPLSAAFAEKLPAEAGAGKPAEAAQPAEKKISSSKLPYHGKVVSVDASAKTFSIKGKEKERVFNVTEATKITKDGAAADITAIAVGEEVRGQAAKNSERWDAVSVMLGAKVAVPKQKGAEAKTAKVDEETKK